MATQRRVAMPPGAMRPRLITPLLGPMAGSKARSLAPRGAWRPFAAGKQEGRPNHRAARVPSSLCRAAHRRAATHEEAHAADRQERQRRRLGHRTVDEARGGRAVDDAAEDLGRRRRVVALHVQDHAVVAGVDLLTIVQREIDEIWGPDESGTTYALALGSCDGGARKPPGSVSVTHPIWVTP